LVMSTLRKTLIVLSIIMLVIILTLGCHTNRGPTEDSNELYNRAKTKQSGRNESAVLEGRVLIERARRIKQDIEKQKYIKVSSVILIGDTAVIGIIFSGDKPGANNGMLRREMENRIRKLDKSLNNVVITMDPDLFENISSIEDMIGKGASLNSLARDIAEVLRNIDFSHEE